MTTNLKYSEELIGQCLSEDLKYHIKKYISPADYGFVAHQHGIGLGTIERIFRNNQPIPVSERSYPAIHDLVQIALTRIEDETEDAKVSKKKLMSLLK